MHVTRKYLESHPDHVFVFGDNIRRYGTAGGASLRDLPNTYGFITKKFPNNNDESFYYPMEYSNVYKNEFIKLVKEIKRNPTKTYLISKLGSGLANRYRIWEVVIRPNMKLLTKYSNTHLLFDI